MTRAKISDNSLALLFSILLAVQFGLQPIISSTFIRNDINKTSIVIGTEITKIVIATLSISFYSSAEREKVFSGWSISDSLKVAALPATLYAIQNVLVQYGYQYLPSMTFNLLNQTKTLSAALWLYLLMGKRQSYMQMFALILLLAAAVILNLDSTSGKGGNEHNATALVSTGVVCVLIASMLSGISAALTQKVLAGQERPRNSFLLSAELAVFGIVFLLGQQTVTTLTQDATSIPSWATFFNGWDVYTLIPVIINAMGGLVVGLVTKYAGGVIKGFALVAGLVFTGVAQWVVDGTPLGAYDWIAAVLVSVAIVIHTSYPPAPITPVSKKKD
mmetsp:Transcript_20230/g.29047  ORF Transcript_20230/g.29047 Transcript_20230/m.29047 type:complete len:332 (+) Transcript_20230:188-1183(+)|eukprot:CAMPEP_0185037394 /NCGR_PEP_ID=MMETSP1103-20130426/31728_1 /TAXON_ID=36769 /ORGANISM="Paraphysomonas bandaiensis, Strain Caron Lab Isolate" /LENGTH=331 /DNA_ID=CAMNT_0027575347 /DNA_START=119 /DNA_END=1114 /DNA_ORIENTATION=+